MVYSIGSGATTKDIVLGAVGINEAMDKLGKEIANVLGEAGDLPTGAIDGIANTFTNALKGQSLDNALGNAMTGLGSWEPRVWEPRVWKPTVLELTACGPAVTRLNRNAPNRSACELGKSPPC